MKDPLEEKRIPLSVKKQEQLSAFIRSREKRSDFLPHLVIEIHVAILVKCEFSDRF